LSPGRTGLSRVLDNELAELVLTDKPMMENQKLQEDQEALCVGVPSVGVVIIVSDDNFVMRGN